METDTADPPVVSFRPAKRQKFLRKRADSDDTSHATTGDTTTPRPESSRQETTSDSNEDTTTVMRLQKPRRLRKGGIEFSTSRKPEPVQDPRLESALAENAEADLLKAKLDRFTAHTGQKVDVDKHMMEYIESELAKRQNRRLEHDQAAPAQRTDRPDTHHQPSSHLVSRREPAALGKLQEIDLGQETTLQNIARTAEATRRMAGESSSQQPLVDKNGSGWRNRSRKHEDIERDRLVEEVLRESKLDLYDEIEQDVSQDDQAADDRIADQFRRDFMEAIKSRRRTARARAATSTTTGSKNAKSEVPRGPKLGGSRSARAAMREMQAKSKQKPS